MGGRNEATQGTVSDFVDFSGDQVLIYLGCGGAAR